MNKACFSNFTGRSKTFNLPQAIAYFYRKNDVFIPHLIWCNMNLHISPVGVTLATRISSMMTWRRFQGYWPFMSGIHRYLTKWPATRGFVFFLHLPWNLNHTSLLWRHNGRDVVSNRQPHDCLLNRLFRRKSKKTSKLRVTGLCAGNSPVTGEFPAQRTSNAENASIWWRHHVEYRCYTTTHQP